MTTTITTQKSTSTKEKILLILAEKWPLSAKEIFEKTRKEHATESTYQAIHKTIQDLENEKTIEKTGKGYRLNLHWLQQNNQFYQKTLEKYKGNLNRYDIPKEFEGTIAFEFDSFTELTIKTAELLESRILVKNKDPSIVASLEFGLWTIKFRFDDLYLLFRMIVSCPKSKCIIRNDTPFGRWIMHQYMKTNVECGKIGTKIDIHEDIIIQGDYIIEIKFSDEGKKIIDKCWNKWKSINDTLKDFGLKPEPKIYSKVYITKSPQLANFMRKELEKYFIKETKKK